MPSIELSHLVYEFGCRYLYLTAGKDSNKTAQRLSSRIRQHVPVQQISSNSVYIDTAIVRPRFERDCSAGCCSWWKPQAAAGVACIICKPILHTRLVSGSCVDLQSAINTTSACGFLQQQCLADLTCYFWTSRGYSRALAIALSKVRCKLLYSRFHLTLPLRDASPQTRACFKHLIAVQSSMSRTNASIFSGLRPWFAERLRARAKLDEIWYYICSADACACAERDQLRGDPE